MNQENAKATNPTLVKSASQRLKEYIEEFEKQKSLEIAWSIINCCEYSGKIKTSTNENIRQSKQDKPDYLDKAINDDVLNNDLSVYDLLIGNCHYGEPIEFDVNKNYNVFKDSSLKINISEPKVISEKLYKQTSAKSQTDLLNLLEEEKVDKKSSACFMSENQNLINNDLSIDSMSKENCSQSILNKTEDMSFIMEDIEKRTKKLLENPNESSLSNTGFYAHDVEQSIVNSCFNLSD